MFTRSGFELLRVVVLVITLFSASGNLHGSANQLDGVCGVRAIPGKANKDIFMFGDIVIGETKVSSLEEIYEGFDKKFFNIGHHVKQYCLIDTTRDPKIVAIFSGDFYDGFKTLASLEIIAGEPKESHQLNCKSFVGLPEENGIGVSIGMSEKELFSIGSSFLEKDGNKYCLKQFYSEDGIYYHNNMFVTLQDQKVTGIFVQRFGEPE